MAEKKRATRKKVEPPTKLKLFEDKKKYERIKRETLGDASTESESEEDMVYVIGKEAIADLKKKKPNTPISPPPAPRLAPKNEDTENLKKELKELKEMIAAFGKSKPLSEPVEIPKRPKTPEQVKPVEPVKPKLDFSHGATLQKHKSMLERSTIDRILRI